MLSSDLKYRMATLPSLSQIAGNYGSLYEAYFNQADASGKGLVGAKDAASFLKRSGLNEKTLGQIWSLSDPNNRGYLDKLGLFVALKLIALTQNNMESTLANIISQAPPPNLADVGSPPNTVGDTGWQIKPHQKAKYDQVFNSLNPVQGKIPGSVVKPVLLNSKLPLDVLGRIWDLSDIDKDGYLDSDEFSIAMHLVYRALENIPIPLSLPQTLISPSKRKKSLSGALPILSVGVNNASGFGSLPGSPSHKTAPTAPSIVPASGFGYKTASSWVVTAAEKASYDVMFKNADKDIDGFVTGLEIRDPLMQTGAPQQVLAHIWGLVDSNSAGKINSEQFALVMHLIHQKLQGIDPPTQLTPEMIPPSLRRTSVDGTTDELAPTLNIPTSNKEIDIIGSEIEQLKHEKINHEKDRAQKEADIKIRSGEVQSLQKELDAITATLNQLETQKGEAQKRLDELDDKRSKLEENLKDLKEKCGEEQRMVDSLRSQIASQEISIKSQEEEMSKLRMDLNDLRAEETKLEQLVDAGQVQLQSLLNSLKVTHQEQQQQNTKLQKLREEADSLERDVSNLPVISNGGLSTFEDSELDMFTDKEVTKSSPLSNGTSGIGTGSAVDDAFHEDPFKKDPFANEDPFHNEDMFANHKEDPFKGEDPFASDPFSEDPFTDGASFAEETQKQEDFFKDDDPFNSAFENAAKKPAKKDPFDPFGDKTSTASNSAFSSVNTLNADPFGSEPFGSEPFTPNTPPARPKSPKPPRPAASPIPRGKSPVPALPPKTKRAPPRPAPPRPKTPCKSSPIPPASNDPFGGKDLFSNADPFDNSGGKPNTLDPFANSSNDAFANFADFNTGKIQVEALNSKTSSEAEQLVWARRESMRQQELQQRANEQEQADLALAIALSRRDIGQSSA